MTFNYDKDTKTAYQDDAVAKTYHDAFASESGFRSLRFRAVAFRERAVVKGMMGGIAHATVIDIPAGTGKLANVLAGLNADIVACDISPNMLSIAKDVYDRIGYRKVRFQVCDAARLAEADVGSVDAVVCLRLMHRVPSDVRKNILAQFALVAGHVVVSYGIESLFHRYRRRLRSLIFGGGTDSLSYENINHVRNELEKNFVILEEKNIIPFLSQERIFLLRAR